MPDDTIAILPSSGMPLNSILQPTHPALRAVGLSGLRFSMTLSEKNILGISSTFLTLHSLVYWSKRRCGALSDLIARIIESYPASTILGGFQTLELFN